MNIQSKTVTCIAVAALSMVSASFAQDETNGDAYLSRALYFADLYNWADAGPLFLKAEAFYKSTGDRKSELYAHFGVIRTTMEQRVLPEVSRDLGLELDTNPLLQIADTMRLFCLTVHADIDGELDAEPMQRDWEAVLDLANKLGDAKWQNRASAEIGFALFLKGDVQTSRQKVGAAIIRATALKDTGAQIRYLALIGTGLGLFGAYGEGATYLDKSAAIAAVTPDAGYQFLIFEGRLQNLKGTHQYQAAEQLGRTIITEAHRRKRFVKEAQALMTLAGVEIAQSEFSVAIINLQRAIVLATDGEFARLLAEAQFDLAEVYRRQKDLPRAEAMARAAAASTQLSGDLYLMPNRLRALAELETSQGRYILADATYDQASNFIDVMIGNVSAVSTKAGLITAMSQVYSEHFALLVGRLNNPAKAYTVLEHARGRIARDLLMKGKLLGSDRESAVEHRISELNLKLTKAKGAREVQRLRDQIFLSEQSRWLAPNAPVSWRARPSTVIALPKIRAMLEANQMILEYVVADPDSYCLVITQHHIRAVRLARRERIERAIAAYLTSIKEKRAGSEGSELYEILLKGIPEIERYERVFVIPDGRLHLVPFEALVDPKQQYLVSSHVISYAASASSLFLLGASSDGPVMKRSFIGVGGIPYDQFGPMTKVSMFRGSMSGKGFGNLPGSEEEIRAGDAAINSSGNRLLTGSKATEAAFKQIHLGNFSVIHLAVHGIANPEHPDRAALILLSDSSAGEDGALQASEIAHLRIGGGLVVLSACETAVGRLQGEEGIANLSRAFLLAGASSVVSTLWSIDDTFSLYLMKRFYAHLRENSTLALSLTLAKRDMLNTFGRQETPYNWAGFTLEGLGDGRLERPRADVTDKSR